MTRTPASRIQSLARTALLLAASCIAVAGPALAQTTAASTPSPAFDVASIRPHQGAVTVVGIRSDADGISGFYVNIPILVQRAYGLLTVDQVLGSPDWATTERYDVQAKMSDKDLEEISKLSPTEATASREKMLQALLADRFKLKAHIEQRQTRVYDLVLTSKPRLKDAASDSEEHLKRGKDGKPIGGFIQFEKSALVAQGYTMKQLANFLSQPFWTGLGRPIIDKTGLLGAYDFTLNWVPQSNRLPGLPGSSGTPDEASSLFSALQEVGLKLQPATGPEDFVIIDHVEKPTDN